MPLPDTIVALGTAPGEGAIGIVRMSGPASPAILLRIFRTMDGSSVTADHFPSQRMRYGMVVHPESGDPLDEVLAVHMRAPRTYTREDVVELHGHGGPAALRRLLEAVVAAGARLAEPGEFTRRAFLNGRIGLEQAEAVIDVIRARTDRALSAALASLSGVGARAVEELRSDMLRLAAHVEAWIDFPEEDIPVGDQRELTGRCDRVCHRLESMLATFREGRFLREGLSVAIVGRPNVGKSSLLNALLREDRAIVTEVPGTTRDTVEEGLSIGGIPVCLVDTAGIRHADDVVEAEGIRRSRETLERADIAIIVLDSSEPVSSADHDLLRSVRGRRAIIACNKCDLEPAVDRPASEAAGDGELPCVRVSAKFGDGIDELRHLIEETALGGVASVEAPLISRARHKAAAERALDRLRQFRVGLQENRDPVLLAVEVRDAIDALEEITGVAVADDILDVIFSEFCIGK